MHIQQRNGPSMLHVTSSPTVVTQRTLRSRDQYLLSIFSIYEDADDDERQPAPLFSATEPAVASTITVQVIVLLPLVADTAHMPAAAPFSPNKQDIRALSNILKSIYATIA
jgi:hypothetical protein